MMFWHDIREADLFECQTISPAGLGSEIVGSPRALEIWRHLIASPGFIGAAIESKDRFCGHRVLGYSAGVFASTDFIATELANPQPGLNSRLIASIDSAHPAVLDYQDIRRANSLDGLNVVF